MEYEIDLSRYLRALVRRWPWMILAAVVFALAEVQWAYLS